jgi:hypothetical protein
MAAGLTADWASLERARPTARASPLFHNPALQLSSGPESRLQVAQVGGATGPMPAWRA